KMVTMTDLSVVSFIQLTELGYDAVPWILIVEQNAHRGEPVVGALVHAPHEALDDVTRLQVQARDLIEDLGVEEFVRGVGHIRSRISEVGGPRNPRVPRSRYPTSGSTSSGPGHLRQGLILFEA